MNRTPISIDRIAQMPAFNAVAPHKSRSEKYSVVPTIAVVNELVKAGWTPVDAQEAPVRKADRMGFQRHFVRLTNENLHLGDEQIDMLLYNSHDGTTSYKVMAGVYRFVCANGMVCGTNLVQHNIRHMGFDPQDVIDASYSVIDSAEEIAGSVKTMKEIEITPGERLALGTAAAELLFAENVRPDAGDLTYSVRREDNEGNLWGAMNAIQENWMNGRTIYRTAKGRRRKNRTPASIAKNVSLNSALWTLAEEMGKLKVA